MTSNVVGVYVISKHNPMVQTYELEVDNLFHKSWHIEKYFGAKQLIDFP
jgi:hypothetical protein